MECDAHTVYCHYPYRIGREEFSREQCIFSPWTGPLMLVLINISFKSLVLILSEESWDQFNRFLGNCPSSPPLSHLFAQSAN